MFYKIILTWIDFELNVTKNTLFFGHITILISLKVTSAVILLHLIRVRPLLLVSSCHKFSSTRCRQSFLHQTTCFKLPIVLWIYSDIGSGSQYWTLNQRNRVVVASSSPKLVSNSSTGRLGRPRTPIMVVLYVFCIV